MSRSTVTICLRMAPLIAASMVAGCSLAWRAMYTGDGTYAIRDGAYQVRLTSLPLDRNASGCSTITRLLGPDREWTVVIRVEPIEGDVHRLYDNQGLRSEFVPRSNVRLTLSDESNNQLFSVSGPLNLWEWGGNRAIRRGRGEEYQSQPGAWEFRRFDVGPDGAWGTSFQPRFSGRYTLCYTVIDPAPLPKGTVVWLAVESYTGFL
jgi:hypothetical protein